MSNLRIEMDVFLRKKKEAVGAKPVELWTM